MRRTCRTGRWWSAPTLGRCSPYIQHATVNCIEGGLYTGAKNGIAWHGPGWAHGAVFAVHNGHASLLSKLQLSARMHYAPSRRPERAVVAAEPCVLSVGNLGKVCLPIAAGCTSAAATCRPCDGMRTPRLRLA